MKNYFYLLLFVASLLIGCNIQKNQVADEKKQNLNFSPKIKENIEKFHTMQTPHYEFRLEKGVYHFYPDGSFEKELYISNHDQTNPKNVAFYLENLKNITIDGNGSTFIFHGTMIPFVLKNCENITLKNFSVDFQLPHLRQLTVLNVDKENDAVTALIEPSGNYVIEDEKLYITVGDYRFEPTWLMAFNENKRLTYNRADVKFKVKKVSEIRPNELKIEGWTQSQYTSAGERLVLRGFHRPTPGIVIDYSKNTVIDNVNLHYAYGMGLVAQMSENVTLNNFSICLKENDTRYFTTQADATHFSACKGVIRSENGLYEAMGDDAINVHGTYLKVIERVDVNTIKAQYMHPQTWGFLWGEVGDQTQFISSNTMDLVDGKTYQIKSIKAVDKPTEFGAKIFEIAFTEPIPMEINAEKSFGIENLTWTPEVIFKNNIIRNNRARGALFSTPKKVICEDNLFDQTHGTAILLCGDSNGWYETGACKDVIIRNNRFVNALTANYQFTNAIISIYPEIPNLPDQKQFFHSGIVIENNIFDTFDEPILYAKSVDNLIFRNNKVIRNQNFEPFHWNKHKFFFERVKNVTIENNLFEKPLTEEDIKINFSDRKDIHVKF
ncbi:MAG: alpha-1,3-galactosidase B [Capnocytophaga sp.]|nr:alpha-1,3-galactosidase B [Capnocytophaga sp.]